jgi:hypothetical protein
MVSVPLPGAPGQPSVFYRAVGRGARRSAIAPVKAAARRADAGQAGVLQVQALASLCLVLFVLTVSVVGFRMLWLARRTRGRPELLIGAGMFLIGTIGYPLGIASGFGRAVGEVNLPLWLVGTLITQAGIGLIYAFTWQVFRPAAAWGGRLVIAGVGFMFASLVVSAFALSDAAPDADSQHVVRLPIFVGMIGYAGCFLWSAIEGFVHHANAKKRLALGLADAVVANRFLLWGVFGLNATAINVSSVVGTAMGLDPSQSPLVLIPMGVFGFGASAAMYLAFLPPAGYLALVQRWGATPA